MAENGPAKLPSSLPLIAAVATIVGAILISRIPLESPRPSPPPNLEPAVQDVNTVDAALWQDPFEVALNHERDLHLGEPNAGRLILRPCLSSHPLSQIGCCIDRAICDQCRETTNQMVSTGVAKAPAHRPPAVHILMVMVPDEQFAEDHEVRLRSRYALLTALRASGMEPTDTRHIDYFRTPSGWKGTPKPIAFPYEWFKPDGFRAGDPNTDTRPRRVLVVWLPQSAFEGRPFDHVVRLLEALRPSVPTWDLFGEMWKENGLVRVDLIGPSFSTVLRAMLDEIDVPEGRNDLLSRLQMPTGQNDIRWLRVYSPWATASPALLVQDWQLPKVENANAVDRASIKPLLRVIPDLFKAASIAFVQMIGTDDLLAMDIINELERRGVHVISGRNDDKADQIVLISEWDTFYGKAFPLTFASMMRSLKDEKTVVDHRLSREKNWIDRLLASRQLEPDWVRYSNDLAATVLKHREPPGNLHVYNYLIGIDGRLPEPQGQEAKTLSSKTGGDSKWAYNENLELPIGQGQLDYARRLAQRLRDEFWGLGRPRLKAIGVVGSDVYDKLILLHAMRERFHDVILFTTDLDARFLHHEQSQWTRNVVVVSGFDLELHPTYYDSASRESRKSPDANEISSTPCVRFRDNYQTALFLACRTALGLHRNNEDAEPALRTLKSDDLANLLIHPRVFEVGHRKAVNLSLPSKDDGFHPPRHTEKTKAEMVNSLKSLFITFGITMLLCIPLARGLTAIASWGGGHTDSDGRSDRRCQTRRIMASCLLGMILLLFVVMVVYDHFERPDGEPFSLTAGTSSWPGLALWLIGTILGIGFIVSSFRILRESKTELAANFKLHEPEDNPSLASDLKRCVKCVQSLAGRVGERRRRPKTGHADSNAPNPAKTPQHRAVQDQPEETAVAHGRTEVDAQVLWNRYAKDGCFYRRFLRTVGLSVVFAALIGVLMWVFGLPFVPCRGFVSYTAYCFLGSLLLVVLLFLLFFVIDAISLCLRLIGPLIANETIWPQDAACNGSLDATTPWSDREGWMDVRFIARMTAAIGKLVYMPAIVLVLMISGRFWYFDRWGFPPQVVLVYAAISLWLSLCAAELLWAAKRARAAALNNLKEKLRLLGFGVNKDKERVALIKAMIEDIQSIRQGAFQPLAENPVLHFLLIPSGGLGLLTLLNYTLPA